VSITVDGQRADVDEAAHADLPREAGQRTRALYVDLLLAAQVAVRHRGVHYRLDAFQRWLERFWSGKVDSDRLRRFQLWRQTVGSAGCNAHRGSLREQRRDNSAPKEACSTGHKDLSG
jgi:hypothetical protein